MESKTKKVVIMTLYSVICLTFITGIFFLKSYIKDKDDNKVPVLNVDLKPINNNKNKDNTKTVFDETDIIMKPFTNKNVGISIGFYNNKDEKENQKNSLIYYEGTYMPSTGIYYTSKDAFDVTSIYNGEIKEIKTDNLLGNILTVDYGNNLIGMYECVDDIKVKVGDKVLSNTILAKSSTCLVFNKGTGFYFELLHNGVNINPEYYYGKTKAEL